MTLRQRPPQGAETIPSSKFPQRGLPRTDEVQGLPHAQQQQGRHPVKWKGIEPRPLSYAPAQTTAWEQQQQEEEEDRALEVARPPTSAIRYRSINQGELLQQLADSPPDEVHILVRRRSLLPQQQALPPPAQQQQKKKRGGSPAPAPTSRQSTSQHIHWLLPLGIGMVVMLVLWLCGSWLFAQGSILFDDLHYGRPRTFQTDAVVGHEDSEAHPSHFIAINLSRHVTIIEFRGGDPSRTRIYLGPTLIRGLDLAPVTLEFRDVTGDGKPDMILHVEQGTYVMINDQGGFRPPQAGDRVNL